MKPPSLISILVPAYNHEKYVETCIRSVLEQDWPRLELIASDDALLPGALSALAKPMLQDPEVGAVVGQNVLMDDAGRLFYWRKGGTVTYDEKEALAITTNEAACGCFGIDQFGPDYGSYATLARGNYIANGCLFRTAVLNRVARFTTEAPLEDYWMHLQVSKVARYRWHAGNTAKQHGKLLAMTSKTIDYEEQSLRQAGDVRHLTDFLIARHPKRWETRWLKLRRRLGWQP